MQESLKKAKIRVATDMYEFIELDIEGTEQEIWDAYKSLKRRALNTPQGLEPKEWNRVLDEYLTSNKMESSNYEKMSDNQKLLIQEIKKSVKRINV